MYFQNLPPKLPQDLHKYSFAMDKVFDQVNLQTLEELETIYRHVGIDRGPGGGDLGGGQWGRLPAGGVASGCGCGCDQSSAFARSKCWEHVGKVWKNHRVS